MLVWQAEERAENWDPTQSEGTYPVTSLVDWRQAMRGGRRRVGEIGEEGRMCMERTTRGMIKDTKRKKQDKKELGQEGKN